MKNEYNTKSKGLLEPLRELIVGIFIVKKYWHDEQDSYAQDRADFEAKLITKEAFKIKQDLYKKDRAEFKEKIERFCYLPYQQSVGERLLGLLCLIYFFLFIALCIYLFFIKGC